MKNIITFTVTGGSRDQLLKEAEAAYRELIDDEEAVLPHNTVLQISPRTVIESGDGSRTVSPWEADVHISVTYG